MRLNYGQLLMWAAVLVSMPRWAGAFISADVAEIPAVVDSVLHYANLIAGVGMGLLEVLASAYMLDAYGRLKPKKTHNAKSFDHRWKMLTAFIAGLFILMPFILAPYIVARMNGGSIVSALPWPWLQYAWSTAVTLSPAFIVGGVAVANGELVATKATAKKRPQRQPVKQPQGQPTQPVVSRVGQPRGTRKLVLEATQAQPNATHQEIADWLVENHQVSISRQMVGKHLRVLNGQVSR